MHRRYFSPELRDTMLGYRIKQQPKLRWMGSQVRLSSCLSLDEESEHSIGLYTYFKNKEIGAGYSSKVYKAKKINSNIEYAIKVIELKKYSTSNMQMLNNQIQILKTLSHPNVLKCYDVYKTDAQCFIVTEYCQNGDLLSHLAKKGRLSERDALQIIGDVVAGYKYLCVNGIIHRDLKPANILKCGNTWKIADFGFAVKAEGELKTKYNVGTPLYMPPEALIQSTYSIKSDIFSIGVILYELLVGSTPWESRTEKDLIKKMGCTAFKIPEKCIISQQMRILLESMCETKMKKRMGKKQFLDLNVFDLRRGRSHQNPEQREKNQQHNNIKSEQSIIDQQNMSSRVSHRSNQALPKIMRLVSSKSILQAKQNIQSREKQNINNQLLICQLHYCRFLYYLVRNLNCFLLQKKQSQKLGLILFTHLVKLVKLISEPNINYLRLENWQSFKKSKKYLNTYLTIKQYSLRYEKQYLAYVKTIQTVVIQQVQNMFPQISKANALTMEFYGKIIRFLIPVIRIFSNSLGDKIVNNSGIVGKEEAGQIQALKTIHKYYRLLQMSVTHFGNYQYFQANCAIKVNVDFKKTGATFESYYKIRRQFRNI